MIFSEAIVNCCDPIINAYEKTGILSGIGRSHLVGIPNKRSGAIVFGNWNDLDKYGELAEGEAIVVV